MPGNKHVEVAGNARLVHEAKRGLIYTSSSIKQLSYALGFADETYFGRFFRKHTSPTSRRPNVSEGGCSRSLLQGYYDSCAMK